MSDNRRKKCVEYITALKNSSCCIRCQQKENLTFHHRNPADKEFEIADARRNRCSMVRLQAEISKCDILCDTCHKLEHEEILELPFFFKKSDFSIKTTGKSGSFIRVKIKHIPTNVIFKGEHEYSRRKAHDEALGRLLISYERN